jgi:pimeloyl-ACP methyl ester carboxylesterase
MAVASGACLHPRLHDGRSLGLAPLAMRSPSLALATSAASANDKAEETSHPDVPRTWVIPTDPVISTPQSTPPLAGDLEALPVAGYPAAWLSLPTGATSKRPVVIVIHGAGDRPERQCRGWRNATSEYPFIICPKGRAAPRYTHIGGAPLLEYIDDALQALAMRYPDYVDTSNPLLAGFSLGASQVTDLAVHFPARFPRIALVEGATKVWDGDRVSAFLEGGGQRVLFGCGQDGVRDSAERTAKRLERLGLDAHVVYANVGHRFAPSLQDAVRSELSWLMDGDERWSTTQLSDPPVVGWQQ